MEKIYIIMLTENYGGTLISQPISGARTRDDAREILKMTAAMVAKEHGANQYAGDDAREVYAVGYYAVLKIHEVNIKL